MSCLIRIIALISLILYPLKLEKKVRGFMNHVYTNRIRTLFNTFGENSFIERNIKVHNGANIYIKNGVHIARNVILSTHSTTSKLIIGSNSIIGEYCHLTACNHISIGCNVLLGRRVLITDNSHGNINTFDMFQAPIKRDIVSKGSVIIEDNVWIGDNVVILPGITIGFGSIIGASSVVTHSIPPMCVAVGNPAKIIKLLPKS